MTEKELSIAEYEKKKKEKERKGEGEKEKMINSIFLVFSPNVFSPSLRFITSCS